MKTPDEDARHERWIGTASGRRQNMAIVTVILILCLVAGLHLALWGLAEPRTTAAPVEGKLPSLSYNRFARPSSGNLTVSEAQIRADLTAPGARNLFPSHPQGRERHRSCALCGDSRSRAWCVAGCGWHHRACD